MPSGSCVCTNCPHGAPDEFQVSISGFTNASCPTCTQLNNNTYTLAFNSESAGTCTWKYTFPGIGPCSAVAIQLQITGSTMRVSFTGLTLATWEKSDLPECLRNPGEKLEWTLSLTSSGPYCNAPSSVTAKAVYFNKTDFPSKTACLSNMANGCSPTGTPKSVPAPHFGVCTDNP